MKNKIIRVIGYWCYALGIILVSAAEQNIMGNKLFIAGVLIGSGSIILGVVKDDN